MFETLLKLVGDNPEAKAQITSIQSQIATSQATSKATIDSLTTQFNDAKTSRDSYKKGNSLVKKALGIDNINDDTIKEKLEALTNNNESAKQLQEYTKSLSAKDDEISTIKADHQAKYDGMRIDSELSKGIDSVSNILSDDPKQRDSFKRYVSEQIGIVGESVSPFTVVGDQRVPIVVDGKPQTVEAYVDSLLKSDEYASFRKTSVKNSAGPTGGSNSNQATDFVPQ